MQNIDEQMLHDLFEESKSELDDLFFCEHETAYEVVPSTSKINHQEQDEHSDISSSTQNSDRGEEFDIDPIPCHGSEQLADYLSDKDHNIDHQEDNRLRAISPGSDIMESSVTPNYIMAKLTECMERSALSRRLVETFCQSSLKASASQENIKISTSKKALKKRRGFIQDNKISVVKASTSRSAKRHKTGSFLRNKSKNQKPSSDSISSPTSSKKNDDFRASGLKVSTKALIAKFKCLERGNQDDGKCTIASFLRREKLNTFLQLSPQITVV